MLKRTIWKSNFTNFIAKGFRHSLQHVNDIAVSDVANTATLTHFLKFNLTRKSDSLQSVAFTSQHSMSRTTQLIAGYQVSQQHAAQPS
jgi:hypothetical protein